MHNVCVLQLCVRQGVIAMTAPTNVYFAPLEASKECQAKMNVCPAWRILPQQLKVLSSRINANVNSCSNLQNAFSVTYFYTMHYYIP